MKAYFAAGCFWGIEKKFSEIEGVTATAVGYMGSDWPRPTYEQVCSGETGHAETVEVDFNPQRVSYETLLGHFWLMHSPTCLNFQGWDVGTQYRSAIFCVDEEQMTVAEKSCVAETKSGRHADPIVTQISIEDRFWCGEEYHQQYLAKQLKL